MPPLLLKLRALRELGSWSAARYLAYQLGKKTGWYRWRMSPPVSGKWRLIGPPQGWPTSSGMPHPLEGAPAPAGVDEVLRGRVTLWGATAPLDFAVPIPLEHWTRHDTAQIAGRDVKFYWEPARFGWAVTLAQAYALHGEARLPEAFARLLNTFLDKNPAYTGPHWANGQEAALRLIHLTAAFWLFPEAAAGDVLALHAARLPPTLIYARAQNNNHLLSEAAALYTAGVALPAHPHAARWRRLGWRWFHHGLQTQIAPDGTYIQQSTNYHRLMLQLALWVQLIARLDAGVTSPQGGATPPLPLAARLDGARAFPAASRTRLAAAARWLLALCDPVTGRVPNLGPNDGAYILPFTDCPFDDYRPVLQAAARAFLGASAFEAGAWDEMSRWFGIENRESKIEYPIFDSRFSIPAISHPRLDSRVFLRAARFTGRPGHADQLHVDIWWRGLNVARDPGTYLYNADAPWDNALQSAFHHNTVTIDGRDQMTRAGRFLYVDRAQATVIESNRTRLTAEHDGYRALGLVHRRTVGTADEGWLVVDEIREQEAGSREQVRVRRTHFVRRTHSVRRTFCVRLHWLLPDWPWELAGMTLRLQSPHGWIALNISAPAGTIRIIRGGEYLSGSGEPAPTLGWYSPNYGVKEPALSLIVDSTAALPLTLHSHWHFPN